MLGRSVYWHDGMFMWPHHMQQEERLRARELAFQSRWNVHYYWGLRSIDIDLEALKGQRLIVRRLQARMPDGVLLSVPEDCPLPALDLKAALAAANPLTILLALPKLKANQPNAPDGAALTPGQDTRYVVAAVDIEDENTGADVEPIQIRTPNARLLVGSQDASGLDVLPIMRVGKMPGNDAQAQLDETFIPPLLACDGWKYLGQRILQDLFDRFGNRMTKLAELSLSRGITFDTHNPGDGALLGQLAVLNEACAALNTLGWAEGVHPFQAYLELCRIVSQLAIYNPARRVPSLPRYNHDDLGFCFGQILHHLEDLEIFRKEDYVQRAFVGENLRMQATLERTWLEPAWQMFVGVESTLKAEEVIRLLTNPTQLGLKIGSHDRVDVIFERGLPGLEFKPADRPPRDLPAKAGLTFFQVNRDSRKEEWLNVQKSLTLAVRFNQNRVVVNAQGTLQGQTVLSIKPASSGAAPATLQFFLYLVPHQA